MKHLLEVIAKALVDQPDKVTVTEKETADAVVLELHVAEGDMGKVIGKQGRIAKAIRTVVKASVDKGDKNKNALETFSFKGSFNFYKC